MEEALARPRTGPRARLPVLNVVLFLATIATTVVFMGPAFAAALLSILLAHEMGHYVVARRYGVDATLPFFIPAPFGIGTFGAVIRIRSALPDRRATLDIGIAGPIAGLVVAIPLLCWGLSHAEVVAVGDAAARGGGIASGLDFARWVGQGILAWIRGGAAPEETATMTLFGDSLATRLAIRAVVGPLPPGHDVLLGPVAFAAWFGLFVTALNLVPLGQLDGGHAVYALLGRRNAERFSRAVSWGLLLSGLFLSFNWLLWWALSRSVIGLRHPAALDETPLGPRRRALAIVSLLLFALTFVPVPVTF
jgi:membrane-associated protease RseP (regulator of RpoE activity)